MPQPLLYRLASPDVPVRRYGSTSWTLTFTPVNPEVGDIRETPTRTVVVTVSSAVYAQLDTHALYTRAQIDELAEPRGLSKSHDGGEPDAPPRPWIPPRSEDLGT